jgi:outer membrane protein TolC
MRWKQVVAGLALTVAGVIGCQKQCFLHECDWEHYQQLGLPVRAECDPNFSIEPASALIPPPSTVDDPDREPRYLTLAEAIAMALENGTVGAQSVINTLSSQGGVGAFLTNDTLVSFTGASVAGSDSIRAFALDPAIVGSNIEASLSKFDAIWQTSMTWNNQDEPVPSSTGAAGTTAGQTGGAFLGTNGVGAVFQSSLLKPLPTGGVVGITFRDQYTNTQAVVNRYQPSVQFQFEQPLLQGFGVEINQLRAQHPGSILTPFSTASRVEGIIITRLRFDEQRAEFDRLVNFMLLNVETAYWNLYNAYWSLYAQEAALRQAYEAWKINRSRYEAGRIAIQDFAQTRQQYELFRGQRLTALGSVLEAERQLRILIGLRGDEDKRLIPVDAPTLAPYKPDWVTSINEALALRPELILARNDLKFRQLDLINNKNLLLPDLRFTSTYNLNGAGTSLDGGSDNALRSLASDRFNDWSLGLRLTVPIGFRDAHSAVRAARLNLARSYLVLQDQEFKAQQFLKVQYRHLQEFHEQIAIQRAQREAAAQQLEARFKEFLAGRGTLDILLEAQRVFSVALNAEFTNIAQYNNALAAFEFAKGTIQQHDNVIIGEGPLANCAKVRAVEHERERCKALVLRERENPLMLAPCWEKGYLGLPATMPGNAAPPVSAVIMPKDDVPEIKNETLPAPQPSSSATSNAGKLTPLPPSTTLGTGDAPSGVQAVPTDSEPRRRFSLFDKLRTLPPSLGGDKASSASQP